MSPGKAAAQVGHAVGRIVRHIERQKSEMPIEYYSNWADRSETKIVLKVDSEEQLLELYKNLISYNESGHWVEVELIIDEGRTEIEPGSYTCLAIEPLPKIHPVVQTYLKPLKLYK